MMFDASLMGSIEVEFFNIESLTLLKSFLRSSRGAITISSAASGYPVSIFSSSPVAVGCYTASGATCYVSPTISSWVLACSLLMVAAVFVLIIVLSDLL